MDKYYDDFRHLFQFHHSSEACCQTHLQPDDDESVFHFRNYVAELSAELALPQGFQELNATRTAQELFRHLKPGDKVAITSRFPFDSLTQAHVDAMQQQRQFQVRVITANQSDIQDFCFLLHSKKELVGLAESTFALWAGILGNATQVRLYSMDTPLRRHGNESFFRDRVFIQYNWTHPTLKQRIHFELYREET